MRISFQFDCQNIDWETVSRILKDAGMAYYFGEQHQKAFQNSHTVVFAFSDETLIGFGRALSDGVYQAALYDVAVLPEYQGQGIGKTIVSEIISRIPHCNVILYAAPGKEAFYEKLNFRKMKTGMALFQNAAAMREKGFTE